MMLMMMIVSKSKIDCPMDGIYNLKNTVNQGTIFSQENVKGKKIILEFRW